MAKLKLSYFDFHGGRGEPARLALPMGGIPFEDDRVPPSEWERGKPNTPFGALPVLEVDGQTLAQSNAINRYVGKLTALVEGPLPFYLMRLQQRLEAHGGRYFAGPLNRRGSQSLRLGPAP
jgi:glutathione S-transferase